MDVEVPVGENQVKHHTRRGDALSVVGGAGAGEGVVDAVAASGPALAGTAGNGDAANELAGHLAVASAKVFHLERDAVGRKHKVIVDANLAGMCGGMGKQGEGGGERGRMRKTR